MHKERVVYINWSGNQMSLQYPVLCDATQSRPTSRRLLLFWVAVVPTRTHTAPRRPLSLSFWREHRTVVFFCFFVGGDKSNG